MTTNQSQHVFGSTVALQQSREVVAADGRVIKRNEPQSGSETVNSEREVED